MLRAVLVNFALADWLRDRRFRRLRGHQPGPVRGRGGGGLLADPGD